MYNQQMAPILLEARGSQDDQSKQDQWYIFNILSHLAIWIIILSNLALTINLILQLVDYINNNSSSIETTQTTTTTTTSQTNDEDSDSGKNLAACMVGVIFTSITNLLSLMCHYCQSTSVSKTITSCLIFNGLVCCVQWICCISFLASLQGSFSKITDLCSQARQCDSDICKLVAAFCDLITMYSVFLGLAPVFFALMGCVSHQYNQMIKDKVIVFIPNNLVNGIEMPSYYSVNTNIPIIGSDNHSSSVKNNLNNNYNVPISNQVSNASSFHNSYSQAKPTNTNAYGGYNNVNSSNLRIPTSNNNQNAYSSPNTTQNQPYGKPINNYNSNNTVSTGNGGGYGGAGAGAGGNYGQSQVGYPANSNYNNRGNY